MNEKRKEYRLEYEIKEQFLDFFQRVDWDIINDEIKTNDGYNVFRISAMKNNYKIIVAIVCETHLIQIFYGKKEPLIMKYFASKEKIQATEFLKKLVKEYK